MAGNGSALRKCGILAAMLLLVAVVPYGYAAPGDETSPPSSQPAAPGVKPSAGPTGLPPPAGGNAAAPEAPLDPEIDKILTRLETRVVRDLRAKLIWQLEYVSLGVPSEVNLKSGEIWYQDAQPVAKFLVHFTQRDFDGRKAVVDERHMFDGFWYTELNSDSKTLIKREVRDPKATSNPYKLGEGPFPLPFGQSKEAILREFVVTRGAADAGDPENTDRMILTPRPTSGIRRTYQNVEFWIARSGDVAGLPVRVRAAKLDGTGKLNSTITIDFSEPQLNTAFAANVFKLEAGPGYVEQVERLEPPPPPAPPIPR